MVLRESIYPLPLTDGKAIDLPALLAMVKETGKPTFTLFECDLVQILRRAVDCENDYQRGENNAFSECSLLISETARNLRMQRYKAKQNCNDTSALWADGGIDALDAVEERVRGMIKLEEPEDEGNDQTGTG